MRAARAAAAPSPIEGAITTSTKLSAIRSAVFPSSSALTATTPPKADSGSHSHALVNDPANDRASAAPHGLVCLTITVAGAMRSATSRYAASVSA